MTSACHPGAYVVAIGAPSSFPKGEQQSTGVCKGMTRCATGGIHAALLDNYTALHAADSAVQCLPGQLLRRAPSSALVRPVCSSASVKKESSGAVLMT